MQMLKRLVRPFFIRYTPFFKSLLFHRLSRGEHHVASGWASLSHGMPEPFVSDAHRSIPLPSQKLFLVEKSLFFLLDKPFFAGRRTAMLLVKKG